MQTKKEDPMEPQKNLLKGAVIALSIALPVLLLAGIGGTYYVMNQKTTDLEKQVADLKAQNEATPKPTVVATDEIAYWNTDYGFQLTLPKTWKNYKVFKVAGSADNPANYFMTLPTVNTDWVDVDGVSKGYASLFDVKVYTKAAWANTQSQEGPKPTLLGQNSNYVFGYMGPNSGPDVGGKDPNFAELAKSKQSVLNSFKTN